MSDQPRPTTPEADFEQKVASAFRPVEPPLGFVDRVMERAGLPASPRRVPAFYRRRWAAAAAVIVAILASVVGREVYIRREREKAALARQQFETALRETDRALEPMRSQLERLGLQLQD